MSKCATCDNAPLPGRLLCAECKAHAAELEHIRLGLKPNALVVHGRRAGGKTLALASIGLALACGPSVVPCDAHDLAAQATLAAKLKDCNAKIKACTTVQCVDAVEADCNKGAETICAEPSK